MNSATVDECSLQDRIPIHPLLIEPTVASKASPRSFSFRERACLRAGVFPWRQLASACLPGRLIGPRHSEPLFIYLSRQTKKRARIMGYIHYHQGSISFRISSANWWHRVPGCGLRGAAPITRSLQACQTLRLCPSNHSKANCRYRTDCVDGGRATVDIAFHPVRSLTVETTLPTCEQREPWL